MAFPWSYFFPGIKELSWQFLLLLLLWNTMFTWQRYLLLLYHLNGMEGIIHTQPHSLGNEVTIPALHYRQTGGPWENSLSQVLFSSALGSEVLLDVAMERTFTNKISTDKSNESREKTWGAPKQGRYLWLRHPFHVRLCQIYI